MIANNHIRTFRDLRVYQNLFQAMILVHRKIVPSLPSLEKFDLSQQVMRSSKAAPALLAEGFAKRYQVKNWAKYINDAIGESNETLHHLTICLELYSAYIDVEACRRIIEMYDIASKQLTALKNRWRDFHSNG